ncbi:hypothetical protein [Pandoravirus japonicus]|uniref:Uncharacterized protein n=1 Tax=Pandoravirus japonicus TaxID=2823154 RepID=A0A811BPE6_9VIRU|nr:hypothetical protein [Pandoravirus japonicus]
MNSCPTKENFQRGVVKIFFQISVALACGRLLATIAAGLGIQILGVVQPLFRFSPHSFFPSITSPCTHPLSSRRRRQDMRKGVENR